MPKLENAITTVLVYTPLRSIKGALEALQSLKHATKRKHYVEMIIQGPLPKGTKLPSISNYNKFFTLRYLPKRRNLGVSPVLADSIARVRTKYWAKLDDDATVPAGAWDLLIKCMDYENKKKNRVGAAFMAPPATPAYILKPNRQQKKLIAETGPYHVNNVSWARWHLVDCAGSGATVFDSEVFFAGCQFSPLYRTCGSDIDMFWQMTQKGFKSIMCTRPCSTHNHEKYNTAKYRAARWSKKDLENGARVFLKRWGLEYIHLRK
jgi:hypothetical protein